VVLALRPARIARRHTAVQRPRTRWHRVGGMADQTLRSVVDVPHATPWPSHCRIPGCKKRAKIKWAELCGMHYARWKRHGTTNLGHFTHRASILQRTRFLPNGCIEWIGHVASNGYGQVGSDGRTQSAHRVIYELLVGPIPDGLTLDHDCHNTDRACPGGGSCRHRRCVNPAHLVLATSRDNTLRSPVAITAINARKTHCKNGHPFDEVNTGRSTGRQGRRCRRCSVITSQAYQAKHGRA
jgi:hypothetical protein